MDYGNTRVHRIQVQIKTHDQIILIYTNLHGVITFIPFEPQKIAQDNNLYCYMVEIFRSALHFFSKARE